MLWESIGLWTDFLAVNTPGSLYEIVRGLAAVAGGYLLGAIPSAYVLGRLTKGIDIRQAGGGNVGAVNTFRYVGKGPALIVLVVDVGKGIGAVLLAKTLGLSMLWVLATGVAAVVGHNWPVWLSFRGGKGVATTLGTYSVLIPREMLLPLPIVALLLSLTRNIAFSIAIWYVLLIPVLWFLHKPGALIGYVLLLTLLGLVRQLPSSLADVRSGGLKSLWTSRQRGKASTPSVKGEGR